LDGAGPSSQKAGEVPGKRGQRKKVKEKVRCAGAVKSK